MVMVELVDGVDLVDGVLGNIVRSSPWVLRRTNHYGSAGMREITRNDER